MRPTAVRHTGPPPVRAEGLGYLPGLDGLRAISVLAVLAYHLDLSWATGGYLGVEVFFVVSGYLITLLLLDEHRRTGAIVRGRFWMRRARRLLPAVILLIVAVVAWTALVPGGEELRRIRDDALASLLYVQNWHAIVADEPYFTSFGRPSPFRHLWSLAIEEQFYLLWPLLLPAALRRHGRRRTAWLLLGGVAVSAAVMAVTADVAAPERAYYGTDTRAFGILLGCALAFGWRPDRFRPRIGVGARRTLEWGGLAALAALLWQLGGRSEYDPWTFPWGFLLVDLLAVALIVACTHPASSLRHRIGSPLLAAVGRRSYSLYLWHWPVIVFTRPGVDWGLEGTAGLAGRLVLVAALAEASYRWIETPFRTGRAQERLWALADRANERRVLGLALTGAAAPVVVLAVVAVTVPAPDAASIATQAPLRIEATTSTTTSTTTPTTAPTTAPTTLAPATTGAPPAPAAATTPPPTTAPPTTAPPTTAAPPPPPTTEPVTGPVVTIVGESVTLGAAPLLQHTYAAAVQIDAVEGRSFQDGVAVIEQLAAGGRLTPTVVVHMGNNGIVPDGALERIDAAVGPDRRLILTTVRVDRRWEGQVNQRIVEFVQSCARCALADWYALATTEPGLTTDDGVHLTEQGQRRYVDLMVSVTG